MDEETIRNEIQLGLLQVDESFVIEEFSAGFIKDIRKLCVAFSAKTESGDEIKEVTAQWD